MTYKLIFQEERHHLDIGAKSHLETIHEIFSSDPMVMAATLRSIANKLDPPKGMTR
jgi:hypothetical protein